MRVAERRLQVGVVVSVTFLVAAVDARDFDSRRHAMTKANAEDKQVDSNEVVYGTSPRGFGIPDDYVAPKLGPLPDHINLGEHPVGVEQSYLVAAPFMMNHSEGKLQTYVSPLAGTTPSPFGDQIGIDPEQTAATAFVLDSPASGSMSWRYPPPPVRIRFNPSRAGKMQAVVTISVVGIDGSIDTKRIRISGVGKTEPKPEPKPEPPKPDAPKIVDEVHRPNEVAAITDAIKPDAINPDETFKPVPPTTDFDDARRAADIEAEALGKKEFEGAKVAEGELRGYKRAPVKPELFEQLVEMAFMMGVSGIAGVVSKYIAKNLGNVLARPPQDTTTMQRSYGPPTPSGKHPDPVILSEPKTMSNDQLIGVMAEGAKEGMKSSAKIAWKEAPGSGRKSEEKAHRSQQVPSTDPTEAFLSIYRDRLQDQNTANLHTVRILAGRLRAAEPVKAQAALEVLANGMKAAAQTATAFHANALSLQWIAAAARESLGEEQAQLPDGSTAETTKLESVRDYGERGWYKETNVPTHDGVLDIHVDVPVGSTPLDPEQVKVRSASMTGIAQAMADRLIHLNLRDAGIPLRFVVHGHPALITRDEIGRVRINGYLLTEDGVSAGRKEGTGVKWTEAHMHVGARALVNKVLSQTLAAWGITGTWNEPNRIATDDARPKDRRK
jgi:hypothetical protein